HDPEKCNPVVRQKHAQTVDEIAMRLPNRIARPLRRAETRMTIRRRDFLTLAGAATLSGSLPRVRAQAADNNAGVYDLERFGNARILDMTGTDAQLGSVVFRGAVVNLGVGPMRGKP